jgi:large subunit ribosomal protein L29
MKQKVIKELTDSELSERLIEEKANYDRLRTNHAVSPIENPMKIREMRRSISRMITELNNRPVSGK